MITVNAYPALVIVLSDLHSLSTILQATQQGSQGSSQQSSKSSNKACSGALRPANSNRSCAFQESEAVTTPSPSTGPWKALGHQNPGTLRVPEPALCTYTATAGALGIPGGVPRSPGHQEPHPQQALSVGTIMEYKYLSSLQKKATPYCSPRIPTSRGCPLPLPKLNLKPAGKVAAGVRGAPPGVQNEGGETGGEHIPLSRNYVPFQKKKRGHLEANQLSRSHTAG